MSVGGRRAIWVLQCVLQGQRRRCHHDFMPETEVVEVEDGTAWRETITSEVHCSICNERFPRLYMRRMIVPWGCCLYICIIISRKMVCCISIFSTWTIILRVRSGQLNSECIICSEAVVSTLRDLVGSEQTLIFE